MTASAPKPPAPLDRELVDLYNESLDRCQSNPLFMNMFYEDFLQSSPRVAEKFQNVDFNRQHRVLRATLYMVALVASGDEFAENYLAKIAEGHDRRHLNIEPDLYDLWRDTLIRTVAAVDPQYNARVESAWRAVLQRGVDYMVQRYDR